MHACTVVNIPLCLPCALLSAPLYYFALLFPSSCSLFVPLAALLLCCLLLVAKDGFTDLARAEECSNSSH